MDAYLTAIEVDPEDAAAFYNIHAALYDDAAPRAAEAALERALTLRPEHADTHFYLAALRQLDRRAGDVATAYADPTKASRELGWTAKYDLKDMCRDGWNWQQKNPDGYP